MPEIRRWRFNFTNNYRFTEGRLKGFNVGGAYRWQDRVAIGYRSVIANVNGINQETIDLNDPFWGPNETAVDLWVGYTRRIAKKYTWRVQLNVRNALGKDELVPINSQPDGGPAAFRISYGADWFLTNSIEF
jgi:outer membrane receptor protein involved in Fe transport